MEIYDEFGNVDLLNRKKTAFLCSRQVPNIYHPRILEWANQCTKDDCIICGCHTHLERQIANQLIIRGIPLIWVATNFEDVKSQIDSLREYVMQNRILILALFGPNDSLSTKQQVYFRNLSVLKHAAQIVVGYRTPNGILDRQLAGYTITNEIIPLSEQHPYKEFLKISNGHLILETLTQENKEFLRILQIQNIEQNQQRNILTIPISDLFRLHLTIEQIIEKYDLAEDRYAEIRKKYPNAFRPWTPEEELLLRQLAIEGYSDEEIAQQIKRQPSAIASRLQKLIEDENKKSEQI